MVFQVKNVIQGDNGNNHLIGNNTAQFQYVNGQLVLSPPDDAIYGYGGNDTLEGRGGNDDLYGSIGNDLLRGGNGNDLLYGGSNNDRLYGDEGNDLLVGDSGNDSLYGGIGNDTLTGGSGNDYLSGQSGFDLVTGGSGADDFSLQNNGSLYYLGNDYATITDFDRVEGDKILVADYGLSNNLYSLGTGNWSGGAALDTGIYFQNNLLAVLQDTTGVSLVSDFEYIPYIAG